MAYRSARASVVPTASTKSASYSHRGGYVDGVPSIFFANMPTLFANADASSIESEDRCRYATNACIIDSTHALL